MLTRRRLAAAALAFGFLAVGSDAHAQEFPTRTITLVVPFPAGSVTDSVARALGQVLQESLGQPLVIENKAGALGTLGAVAVAKSNPDGYTLLMGSSVMFVAKSLYKSLAYDPLESFQTVSGVGSTAMMFMVAESSPIRTVGDLATAVKNAPVTVGFGSPSGQVALALFSTVTKSSPVPVSYRGIPQTLTDLAGGHIQVAVVDIGSGIAQMGGGKMRPITISAATRYPLLPDVPTLEETYPGASGALETIIAIMAPAGTPPAIVARLDAATRAALSRPDVQERFAFLNTTVLSLSAEKLAERIKADNPRWEDLIRKAGIEQQ